MKEIIIAGNWKMNKSVEESLDFYRALDKKLDREHELIDILIFPPFTSLAPLKGVSSRIQTGAQNISCEKSGAYTGEVSVHMIKGLARYTLAGHSERRHIFNEADSDLNKKIRLALEAGLIPLLCVGETLEQREKGQTEDIIAGQVRAGLKDFAPEMLKNVIIAYEPVWAIGTGRTADTATVREVHDFIRELLAGFIPESGDLPLLYGGSVKPANCRELLEIKNVNGLLIGGASLNVEDFFGIIQNSVKLIGN